MKIRTTVQETYVIFEIEGSLSVETGLNFERRINDYLDKKFHAIVDLTGVSFIDSSVLGMIVKFDVKFKNENMQFILTGINEQIYDVFSITHVNKHLKIFDTQQEAIQFLDSK